MKIQKKLTVGSVLLGVVPVVIAAATIGWIANHSAEEALRHESEAQLTAVRDVTKSQIEDYFDHIRNQVLTFSNDRMVIQAAREFRQAFHSYRGDQGIGEGEIPRLRSSLATYYTGDFSSEYGRRNGGDAARMDSIVAGLDADSVALQHTFIKANPNPLGSKDAMDDPGDGTRYAALHRTYHPHIRDFLNKFGYYDIFIADPDTGDIVYTVFKELDFTTSLIDGPYAGTGIGQVFQEANRAGSASAVAISDFAPYKPSYMDQAGFIASPIYDGNEKVGVLIFQMPIDKINDVMTHGARWADVGLGESGETYLVGSDFKMRSESRFLIEDKPGYLAAVKTAGLSSQALGLIESKGSTIGLGEVRTDGTRAALSGQTGFEIFPDYRDVPVLSAYAPLDIPGIDWVIMSEIDEAEAFAPVYALSNKIMGTALTVSLVIFGVAVLIGWGFARSITVPLTRSVKAMHQIADGHLTQRLKVQGNDELAEFASSYNHFADRLSEMIAQVKLGSETVSSGAIEINDGNTDLSQRTEEQAAALEETASSMEEMTSTVKQSAENAIKANQLATGARDQAARGGEVVERAVTAMGEINESSRKIAEIIGMINEIAFQTNLLALNAAVEAARAGEQGRGFAVVASEVRNLAQRSGNAADEIKKLIEDSVAKVQNGSGLVEETGKALVEIRDGITRVSDIVSEINAAGQEQATGIEQVNRAIMQMDEVVQQNAALVEEGAATSDNLADEAGKLADLMTFFKLGDDDQKRQARPTRVARRAARGEQPGFVSKPRRKKAAQPVAAENDAPEASVTEATVTDVPEASERDRAMEDF